AAYSRPRRTSIPKETSKKMNICRCRARCNSAFMFWPPFRFVGARFIALRLWLHMLVSWWYRFEVRYNQDDYRAGIGGNQSHCFGMCRDINWRLLLRNEIDQVLILAFQRRCLSM